jgi:soluble P-type ATPase
MNKPGILIDIPGFGRREITTIVSDYTGTHSRGGKLVEGVRERLMQLGERVDIHVISADSFGTAEQQLKGLPLRLEIIKAPSDHDVWKRQYAERHDVRHVAAFGNGNNDRLMLQTVKERGGLAIAVENGEGCSLDAMLHANLFIVGATNALDLLLDSNRCKATLRF